MKQKCNLIVNGASCTTESPWMTWADLVWKRYNIEPQRGRIVGQKGLGNEAIITRVLSEAYKTDKPFVAVMLTAVDKWDWYTQDKKILDKIKKEKHVGYTIANEKDGAYWCTASHFPLWKEYYKTNYYSLRHMIMNTLKHIDLLIKTCKSQNWPFLILSDYSIFSYLEQEINVSYAQVKHRKNDNLIDATTKCFFDQVKDHMDLDGLFKTGDANNMSVMHKRYGAHPGTDVHYEYCKAKVFPVLDNFFEVKDSDIESTVALEQQLWIDSNL